MSLVTLNSHPLLFPTGAKILTVHVHVARKMEKLHKTTDEMHLEGLKRVKLVKFVCRSKVLFNTSMQCAFQFMPFRQSSVPTKTKLA